MDDGKFSFDSCAWRMSMFHSLSPFKLPAHPALTHNGRLDLFLLLLLWIGCLVLTCTATRPWRRHTQWFIYQNGITWQALLCPLPRCSNEWIYSSHCKLGLSVNLMSFPSFSISRDRFPFYKSNDDRWKNSVRHNLSINPHFRKGNKAPQGAGHLWIISTRDSEANILAWEHVSNLVLAFSIFSAYRDNAKRFNFSSYRKNNDSNCSSKWRKHSPKAWRRVPTFRQLQWHKTKLRWPWQTWRQCWIIVNQLRQLQLAPMKS